MHTGIYVQVDTTSGEAVADQRAVFAKVQGMFAKAGDLDGTLARMEAEAIGALDDTRPEVQRDANSLLEVLGELRRALADANARQTAHWALRVGSLGERLTVRRWEPLVKKECTRATRHKEHQEDRRNATAEKHVLIQKLWDDELKLAAAVGKTPSYARFARLYKEKTRESISTRQVRRILTGK